MKALWITGLSGVIGGGPNLELGQSRRPTFSGIKGEVTDSVSCAHHSDDF
jgi:hypothetical protein